MRGQRVKLPNSAHHSRPWRIHEIAHDFRRLGRLSKIGQVSEARTARKENEWSGYRLR
jgi:hypothetical protein